MPINIKPEPRLLRIRYLMPALIFSFLSLTTTIPQAAIELSSINTKLLNISLEYMIPKSAASSIPHKV